MATPYDWFESLYTNFVPQFSVIMNRFAYIAGQHKVVIGLSGVVEVFKRGNYICLKYQVSGTESPSYAKIIVNRDYMFTRMEIGSVVHYRSIRLEGLSDIVNNTYPGPFADVDEKGKFVSWLVSTVFKGILVDPH